MDPSLVTSGFFVRFFMCRQFITCRILNMSVEKGLSLKKCISQASIFKGYVGFQGCIRIYHKPTVNRI